MDRYLWMSHLKEITVERSGYNQLRESVHGVKAQVIIRTFNIKTSLGCATFIDSIPKLKTSATVNDYFNEASSELYREAIIASAASLVPDIATLESLIPATGKAYNTLYGYININYAILNPTAEVMDEFRGYSMRGLDGEKIASAELNTLESNVPFYVLQAASGWTPVNRLVGRVFVPERAHVDSVEYYRNMDTLWEAGLFFDLHTEK